MKKELPPGAMFGAIAVGIILLGAIGYSMFRSGGEDISPEEKKKVDQTVEQQYKGMRPGPPGAMQRR